MKSSWRKKNDSFSENPPRKSLQLSQREKCTLVSLPFGFSLLNVYFTFWFFLLLCPLLKLSFIQNFQGILEYATVSLCRVLHYTKKATQHSSAWFHLRLTACHTIGTGHSWSHKLSSAAPQRWGHSFLQKRAGEIWIPKIPTVEYRMFGFALSCWEILTCASYRGKESNTIRSQQVCIWLQSRERLQ